MNDRKNFHSGATVSHRNKELAYEPGNTLTGASILYALDEAFTPLHGARKAEEGIEKILIVLTDGRAQDNVQERVGKYI